MRAERAKPKSWWDDEKVAQDKRSAVLGYGREMITSLFSRFGLPGRRPAKPNLEKREAGGWVSFTQGGGSACAALRRALPWAGMSLPLWGVLNGDRIRRMGRMGRISYDPTIVLHWTNSIRNGGEIFLARTAEYGIVRRIVRRVVKGQKSWNLELISR